MRLKDLLENDGRDTIEIQADGVADSISDLSPRDLDDAVAAGTRMLDGDASDEDYDAFYKAARYIVEPNIRDRQAQEDFNEFMDNDMDNWVGWIKSTFGDDWGLIAKVVAEEGY